MIAESSRLFRMCWKTEQMEDRKDNIGENVDKDVF